MHLIERIGAGTAVQKSDGRTTGDHIGWRITATDGPSIGFHREIEGATSILHGNTLWVIGGSDYSYGKDSLRMRVFLDAKSLQLIIDFWRRAHSEAMLSDDYWTRGRIKRVPKELKQIILQFIPALIYLS